MKPVQLEDLKVGIRAKLAGLWIVLMLLYIYADIFSLYRPGHIDEMIAGFMGPLPVSQMTLGFSAILMAVPALMVLACLFMGAKGLRGLSIAVGTLYVFIGVGNLIGETWVYYLIYGMVQILLTLLIVLLALKWPKKA